MKFDDISNGQSVFLDGNTLTESRDATRVAPRVATTDTEASFVGRSPETHMPMQRGCCES